MFEVDVKFCFFTHTASLTFPFASGTVHLFRHLILQKGEENRVRGTVSNLTLKKRAELVEGAGRKSHKANQSIIPLVK
jgi:hypothetical protein